MKALDGLALRAVTYFVGENGSGKPTILEAIAVAAGFNAEGGTANFQFATRRSESPLRRCLRLARIAKPKAGFFLRAESFFNGRNGDAATTQETLFEGWVRWSDFDPSTRRRAGVCGAPTRKKLGSATPRESPDVGAPPAPTTSAAPSQPPSGPSQPPVETGVWKRVDMPTANVSTVYSPRAGLTFLGGPDGMFRFDGQEITKVDLGCTCSIADIDRVTGLAIGRDG